MSTAKLLRDTIAAQRAGIGEELDKLDKLEAADTPDEKAIKRARGSIEGLQALIRDAENMLAELGEDPGPELDHD